MEAHDIVQEAVIKNTSKKKKCKMVNWLSEEALQISEKENQKTKEKHAKTHTNQTNKD